jgi:hypothetical protein
MRLRLASVLLLALALVWPGGSAADLLHDVGAAFESVARELAGAFPKAETRVTAVDGDEVTLAGPGVSALRPGLELLAYRRGEPFRHPITSQVLGHAEEEVATLVVAAVTGDTATARVAATEGERRPQVGDGARITAGRISVAVLPTTGVSVPGETGEQTALLMVSRFSALLEKTGRFVAVEPRRVLDVVAPPGGGAAPPVLEAARRLRASAVVVTRVIQDGRARQLETTWISARTGTTLFSARTPISRTTYPPRFAWERTPELERKHTVDGTIRGLALGDLDGDGRPELAVADERVVSIHRWQENTGPAPTGIEFRTTGTILSVDLADVTGAGRAQLVVVDYAGTTEFLTSTVLELNGERLRPLHEVRGRYLRVVPVGREPWLLEQAAGGVSAGAINEPFQGSIHRLVWRDGAFRTDRRLQLPSGISVYGLALLRLTGGPEPDVVAITPEDRVSVWNARGQRLWTSPDPYGGSAITFPYSTPGQNREAIDAVGRVYGRVFPLAGSDEPEILLFENILPIGSQVRTVVPRLTPLAFNEGRMHRLRWRDGAFQRVWQSQNTDGYIADFTFGDLDGDAIPEVVVGVVPRGLATLNPLNRTRGQLVLYELP